MGIFGDILGGIGEVARSPIGQQIGGALAARLAPRERITQVYLPSGSTTGPSALPMPVSAGQLPVRLAVSATPGSAEDERSYLSEFADWLQGQDPNMLPGLYTGPTLSVRPIKRIYQQNPQHPERIDVWEHAGRPVLYSRDLATCRRVRRIARHARRRLGGR